MSGIPPLFYIFALQMEVIPENGDFCSDTIKDLAQFLLLHTYYFPEHI